MRRDGLNVGLREFGIMRCQLAAQQLRGGNVGRGGMEVQSVAGLPAPVVEFGPDFCREALDHPKLRAVDAGLALRFQEIEYGAPRFAAVVKEERMANAVLLMLIEKVEELETVLGLQAGDDLFDFRCRFGGVGASEENVQVFRTQIRQAVAAVLLSLIALSHDVDEVRFGVEHDPASIPEEASREDVVDFTAGRQGAAAIRAEPAAGRLDAFCFVRPTPVSLLHQVGRLLAR